MKTVDVLYHWNEPPSFGALALADAQLAGVVRAAVPMIMSTSDQVIDVLRRSDSDAILCASPAQYQPFFDEAHRALRAIGKPLLSFSSEWCYGNPMTAYAAFEDSGDRFDVSFYGQACDMDTMRVRGRRAFLAPAWVSTLAFRPGPPIAQRTPRLAFIGDTQEYAPGVYATRRRLLEPLVKRGLVDVFKIPKGVQTAHHVAHLYATYAGVFCPASNGRAQGIRCYEAAATGALIVEAQPMDPRNEFFPAETHRIAFDPEIDADALADAVAALDFAALQPVATAAHQLVCQRFHCAAALRAMLATADTALG